MDLEHARAGEIASQTSQLVTLFKALQAKVKRVQLARDQALREREELSLRLRRAEREREGLPGDLQLSPVSKNARLLEERLSKSRQLVQQLQTSVEEEKERHREVSVSLSEERGRRKDRSGQAELLSSQEEELEAEAARLAELVEKMSRQVSKLDRKLKEERTANKHRELELGEAVEAVEKKGRQEEQRREHVLGLQQRLGEEMESLLRVNEKLLKSLDREEEEEEEDESEEESGEEEEGEEEGEGDLEQEEDFLFSTPLIPSAYQAQFYNQPRSHVWESLLMDPSSSSEGEEEEEEERAEPLVPASIKRKQSRQQQPQTQPQTQPRPRAHTRGYMDPTTSSSAKLKRKERQARKGRRQGGGLRDVKDANAGAPPPFISSSSKTSHNIFAETSERLREIERRFPSTRVVRGRKKALTPERPQAKAQQLSPARSVPETSLGQAVVSSLMAMDLYELEDREEALLAEVARHRKNYKRTLKRLGQGGELAGRLPEQASNILVKLKQAQEELSLLQLCKERLLVPDTAMIASRQATHEKQHLLNAFRDYRRSFEGRRAHT